MFNANAKKPYTMRSPQPAVNPMVQPQFFFDQKLQKRDQGDKLQPKKTMADNVKAKNKRKQEMKANRNKTPKRYGDISDTSSLKRYSRS
jgi:hypothetical protein